VQRSTKLVSTCSTATLYHTTISHLAATSSLYAMGPPPGTDLKMALSRRATCSGSPTMSAAVVVHVLAYMRAGKCMYVSVLVCV